MSKRSKYDRDDRDFDREETSEERRERRHKRRVRSQIIVYITVVIFILLLILGAFLGVKKLQAMWKNRQAQIVEQQQEEEAQAEEESSVTVSEPEEVQVQSRDEMLEEIVNSCISEMPIEDKVAGLFMITPEQLTGVDTAIKAGTGTQDALSTYAVGGLLYSGKNIQDSEQITQMLTDTSNMSKYPLFLAARELGGAEQSPVATAIGADIVASARETESAAQAGENGTAIGTYLSQLGFNLNLGPMIGLGEDEIDFYGSDASTASELISSFVNGLKTGGVSSALIAFPAVAEEGESENGIESTDSSLDDLRATAYVTLQAGIDAGAEMIMVSNIAAPAVTGDNTPSCLSTAIVTDVLRSELSYNGIIMTDALDSTSITDYYTADQAAVAAIKAGADIIYLPEDFSAAYQGLLAAVQDGDITEDRIDESLKRIYRVKYASRVDEIVAQNGTLTENNESTGGSEDIENSESTENGEGIDNTESTEDIENTENNEN